MDGAEIARTIEDFASGAHRARELGFNAVEIMGSEGYLLNQFLSPLTNRRGDEWGGDFVRRTRFPRAVLSAVRDAVGPGFPVIYRISGADLMPDSTSDDEMLAFARLLAAEGADALDVGVGWHESSTPTVQYTVAAGAWLPYARRIREAIAGVRPFAGPTAPAEIGAAAPVAVIASTRIHTLQRAEQALAAGEADFVALARPFLADPWIIAKARSGRGASINVCIACNQACIDRSLRDERVSCMVNPRAGWEAALHEPQHPSRVAPRSRRSFAVIGGGPAGLEAARTLASLGHRVRLYEAAPRLGGQFRLACRIPGKEDFALTIDHFERELRRLGAEVRLGHRIDDASAGELNPFDGVIVATGVVPRRIELPGIDLPSVRCYTDALLDADAGGGPVAIIGAGGVGVDVAHYFARRRQVTLMCRGGVIGARIGRSTRWVLLRELRERNVRMLSGIAYERIVRGGVWIRMPDGARRLIEAETIVIAAGQESREPLRAVFDRPNRPVRAVGGARVAAELDAVRAFREGALAARELAGIETPP
jgi:2,4-dienoyl-CoA reductase (NADPH2)